jgi:hypothetical protein
MRPTLVFIRHHEIDGRIFIHGSELQPDLLAQDVIDKLIDKGVLREYPERRSLYRPLHIFSGCKEREPLTQQERDAYALPK